MLQVAAVLGALSVAALAVPLPGIEEEFAHYPLALSHAPTFEIPHAPVAIAHAPVAVAHTPIIKTVEHVVSQLSIISIPYGTRRFNVAFRNAD